MANLTNSNPYPSNITVFPENVVRLDITDRVKAHDPAYPGVLGKANEQPKSLLDKLNHLLFRIVGIETTLSGFNTTTLSQLDLQTLKMENTRQLVTIAAGDTTKTIDLNNGAVVSLTLNNTAACSLVFNNPRGCLSGMLVLTANNADRTIILPATWQPQDVSRTLVIRSGQKRIVTFEVETLTPSVIYIASVLSEPLLTT